MTGSGGRQLFYRASRRVRNSANGELGVDVRGDGGFVVAPPSIHPSGEGRSPRIFSRNARQKFRISLPQAFCPSEDASTMCR